MVREPRDVLVSLYRLYKADPGYFRFTGNWDDFFGIFEARQLLGGDWFQNTLSWLQYEDRDNILIVQYEKVLGDSFTYIKQMTTFCNKRFTDDQIRLMADNVNDEVRDETATGEWKKFFSNDQERRFKQLYDKHINGTELYCIE